MLNSTTISTPIVYNRDRGQIPVPHLTLIGDSLFMSSLSLIFCVSTDRCPPDRTVVRIDLAHRCQAKTRALAQLMPGQDSSTSSPGDSRLHAPVHGASEERKNAGRSKGGKAGADDDEMGGSSAETSCT